MNALQNEYASEYGWAISLPDGWEKLPDSAPGAISMHKPVVFCKSDDFDLALTWMKSGRPVMERDAERFIAAISSLGPIDKADIIDIVGGTFHFIGEPDKAEVIQLPDGSHVLEVTEKYLDSGSAEMHAGYQLIWPVKDAVNYPLTFQRLCFYAPFRKYYALVNTVRQAARSFHYVT